MISGENDERSGIAVIRTDLSAEKNLFCGKGDYQFDIYRMMKEENWFVYLLIRFV